MRLIKLSLSLGMIFLVLLTSVSAVSLPNSMSAMGDSITQAANLGFSFPGDNPEHSWSTGYVSDIILSHFERIAFLNPNMIRENSFNNAVSGAKVHDLMLEQLPLTLSQNPEYITLMIGSNDVCHGTSLQDFEVDYRNTVNQLTTQLPNTKILLVSTPNIARLLDILGDNSYCRLIWNNFNLCPKLFGDNADIIEFRKSVIATNNIIKNVADNSGANVNFVDAYNYKFKPRDVSDLDCFHPSMSGQSRLAELIWKSGFYR